MVHRVELILIVTIVNDIKIFNGSENLIGVAQYGGRGPAIDSWNIVEECIRPSSIVPADSRESLFIENSLQCQKIYFNLRAKFEKNLHRLKKTSSLRTIKWNPAILDRTSTKHADTICSIYHDATII